jgi:hypothetical protein
MRQELPIVGGFYKNSNRHWSAEDVLNYLPVKSESGGSRTQFELKQAPGPKPFVEIYTEQAGGDPVYAGPVRGLTNVEGKLYVVAGTTLFQVTSALTCIPRGTIPGVGLVSMAHNQQGLGNELAVDNGSARYVLNTLTNAFQKVNDPGFPGSFMAFYIDQYLGFIEPQGRFWGHSDLADALNYSELDAYEAEADPDRIVSAIVSHREVLIFGKDTIEPFVNAPSTSGGIAPFQRASNTVIECGCSARYSVVTMDNSVFWLDDKRVVRKLEGYNPMRISTAGVEQALRECTPEQITRAYAFTWEDEGHKVYYLTVPGKFTFGFDLLSQEWARRSSPGLNTWRLSSLTFWNGQWIGGDLQAGKLYVLDWDYSFDGQEELVRERVSGVLAANQNPLTVHEIELLFNVGGPVSVVADFPAQPIGPALAPDTFSEETTTVAQTIAGMAGDNASLSYTIADQGDLPDTVLLATDGDLTGTATSGTYTFTARVTDGLGLWAEAEFILEVALS